jgi:hypothetical protein
LFGSGWAFAGTDANGNAIADAATTTSAAILRLIGDSAKSR